LVLTYRLKARARREISKAAEWWAENRPAAPGAIREDTEAALKVLVRQPGLGSNVDTVRAGPVRRFLLLRTQYCIYYRVRGKVVEVVAFWHASRETGPSL
jgi:plasmid stabilization system protein ParE